MNNISLDLIDRKILSELDKNCRISNNQLGKIINKSRETVKYRIAQLEKKGIITGYITSINPAKLGYYMFKVYLKLENIPKEKKLFFEELKKNKNIYWLGISDGAFDCVIAILSKSVPEYYSDINNLLSKWEHLIVSKVMGTMVDFKQYHKKFFLNETDSEVNISGGDIIQNKIDELDHHILRILANDARVSLVALAKKTNSTIDIIRTRVKQLELKGIILTYRISIDFNKLGLGFFKLFIYFRKISKEDEKKLSEWLKIHPNSAYYIRSLAPWEMEPEFYVESYQEFNQIVNDLREEFPHAIRNCEHLIFNYETWMPAYEELLK
jgi:DNA-binding Lrp family transcriptional regulator